MKIDRFDHIVLTVENIEAACKFYTEVLGMEEIYFGDRRKAVRFGKQKINFHQVERLIPPVAQKPTPGSADMCLITSTPMAEVVAHMRYHEVEILEGPVPRIGAMGTLLSIYFRDPSGNLIEVSNYE